MMPDLKEPLWFLAATAVIFGMVTIRYFVVAGIFYLVFYSWRPQVWTSRRINDRPFTKKQFRTEVLWSLVTSVIFALAGAVSVLLWQRGSLRVYEDVAKYSWWWLPGSMVVALLLHETYYYWLHRWMHRPAVFRIVHRVHHASRITSPWTAFSFHPLEGLLQAIFLPLLLLVMPMHLYVVLYYLTLMTFSSVINHLDVEIYPAGFHRHVPGRWLIGATHHSLHHTQFRYNFGLYFTFWDRWGKTESPLFGELFEKKTRKAPDANP
ncbi:MAG TPA: sterol desaturase family protein [Flavisolibacter sp.]